MPSRPQVTPRSRAWVFTLNNYQPYHEELLQRIRCQYLVFGREVGESGTPHLQGYIYFTNAKKLHQVRALVPGAHLEVRRGTHAEAREYCIKDGNIFEKGEPPMDILEKLNLMSSKAQAKWAEIHSLAKKGKVEDIATEYPKEYCLHKPRLESLYDPKNSPMEGELLHEWWVGPTGTGKSKTLWELYPDHFSKGINKWWDGYKHEDVVAIEEWSPDHHLTTQSLKKWADRYPFPGEIKGGNMTRLRPKKIIVLSNYTLEQCFPRSEDLSPLKRRFTEIKFPEEIQRAKFRAAWFNNPPDIEMETAVSEATSATEDLSLPEIDLDFLFSQE